jgi:hypothetical protein
MPIILQDILDAQTAATDAQIASLTAQLATAQAALTAAQAQLGPLNAQVAALTAQVADLQAQIAALQPPVASTWNTGYRGPITGATVSGTITTDTVIENKSLASMAGFVVTGGANFTLRNCLLPYTGAFGIDAQGTGRSSSRIARCVPRAPLPARVPAASSLQLPAQQDRHHRGRRRWPRPDRRELGSRQLFLGCRHRRQLHGHLGQSGRFRHRQQCERLR